MASHPNNSGLHGINWHKDRPEVPKPFVPKPPKLPLRFHKRAFVLLFTYLPLIIIPWILTWVLSGRPFSHTSYINHPGFSPGEIIKMQRWVTAINVFNSIASLVTIPILSAMLAQAAVVYSQRRSAGQNLSVRHIFALADRGWSDVGVLWRSRKWKEPGTRVVRVFLYLAAGLMLTSLIQQPLYQLLVSFEQITVTACLDTSYMRRNGYGLKSCSGYRYNNRYPASLGIDVEPAQIAMQEQRHMIAQLNPELASITSDTPQPRLWVDYNDKGIIPDTDFLKPSLGNMRWNGQPLPFEYEGKKNMFVTAFFTNTTTGVLRQHAMRLNSSIECAEIDRSQFPDLCTGTRPLVIDYPLGTAKHDVGIQICVPGEYGRSPWTLSRNRQDLVEEMFLAFNMKENQAYHYSTFLCKAGTTRGFFELGNYYNNQTYGPLSEKWPSREEMLENFNDYLSYVPEGAMEIPSEIDPIPQVLPPKATEIPTSNMTAGPLMTTAIALFGNESWYKFADSMGSNDSSSDSPQNTTTSSSLFWEPTCKLAPFNRLTKNNNGWFCGSKDYFIDSFLWVWLLQLNSTTALEKSLAASMFLANQAVLTMNGPEWQDLDYAEDKEIVGRKIYYSPGMTVQKPKLSFAAKIGISVLVGLQVVGLVVLTAFIYHVPTWTTVLDATAMAYVGTSLDPSIKPLIGPMRKSDPEQLKEVSGLIGVDEVRDDRSHLPRANWSGGNSAGASDVELKSMEVRVDTEHEVERQCLSRKLELGAPGVITWRMANQGVRPYEQRYRDP